MRVPISSEQLEKYKKEVGPLKDAFDLIHDHVAITDENANIIYANRAVEEATGFSYQEIIGKNPADLWGGHMPKEFYEKMWHTIKDEKKPFMGEVKNVRKDGAEIWQEIHISPVLDLEGKVKYFIAVEPNVTSRKRHEELNGEFTSIVGHQLKAPLTAVKLFLDWLISGGGLTTEQKRMVEGAYENTKSLSDLVADLLLLRRLDYAHLQSDTLKIDDGLTESVQLIKAQFPGRNLVLNIEPGYPYKIASNKQLACQVFINLITNAIEYSTTTSSIVEITLSKPDGIYLFTCQDHGVGIPEADQKNIFGRFFRASNANDEKKTGTGLGLFIVRMICESFGWKVYFESKVGVGTKFFVEMRI